MADNELNITWCYPDILNLHGDRGNIMALKRIGEMLGLTVNIKKIETYNEKIDFENTDILFFNTGELKVVKNIIQALNKQREELVEYIEKGKVAIAIGTTGAVFAKQITRLNNEKIESLGLLDMDCKERELVYGDDILYTLNNEETEINGSQIQIIDTYLNSDIALGHIKYGHGNNGNEEKQEGARYKNLVFTNALGPVFVKNPWFAEQLIRTAMKNKNFEIEREISDNEYEVEKKSMQCIKDYIEKKNSK